MNALHDLSMARPYVAEQGLPQAKHTLAPFAAEPFAVNTVNLFVFSQFGATEGRVTALSACVGVHVRAGVLPLSHVDARHVLLQVTPSEFSISQK